MTVSNTIPIVSNPRTNLLYHVMHEPFPSGFQKKSTGVHAKIVKTTPKIHHAITMPSMAKDMVLNFLTLNMRR